MTNDFGCDKSEITLQNLAEPFCNDIENNKIFDNIKIEAVRHLLNIIKCVRSNDFCNILSNKELINTFDSFNERLSNKSHDSALNNITYWKTFFSDLIGSFSTETIKKMKKKDAFPTDFILK